MHERNARNRCRGPLPGILELLFPITILAHPLVLTVVVWFMVHWKGERFPPPVELGRDTAYINEYFRLFTILVLFVAIALVLFYLYFADVHVHVLTPYWKPCRCRCICAPLISKVPF